MIRLKSSITNMNNEIDIFLSPSCSGLAPNLCQYTASIVSNVSAFHARSPWFEPHKLHSSFSLEAYHSVPVAPRGFSWNGAGKNWNQFIHLLFMNPRPCLHKWTEPYAGWQGCSSKVLTLLRELLHKTFKRSCVWSVVGRWKICNA